MRKLFFKDAIFYILLIVVVLGVSIGVQRACLSKKRFEKLSYSWELSLKNLAKTLIEKDSSVVKNAYLNKAADMIIKRLTANLENNPYKIEVLIVDSPVVNAFAFPGGLIVVYSGLIKKMGNAEEFASLLAHELGHIIHRDSIKALVRQLGMAALLAVGGSDATAVLREVIKLLVNNSFSRQQEEKADNFAAKLLIRSAVSPRHFASFLTNLKKEKKREGALNGVWVYLSTHPDIDSRIRAAEEKVKLFTGEERKFDIDWQRARLSIAP